MKTLCLLLLAAARLRSATPFALAEPGSNWLIDYAKYGRLEKPGTRHYAYKVYYRKELAQASGEGIYPNTESLNRDAAYLAMKARLELPAGDKGFWTGDPDKAQENFYRWASSKQPEGVK